MVEVVGDKLGSSIGGIAGIGVMGSADDVVTGF